MTGPAAMGKAMDAEALRQAGGRQRNAKHTGSQRQTGRLDHGGVARVCGRQQAAASPCCRTELDGGNCAPPGALGCPLVTTPDTQPLKALNMMALVIFPSAWCALGLLHLEKGVQATGSSRRVEGLTAPFVQWLGCSALSICMTNPKPPAKPLHEKNQQRGACDVMTTRLLYAISGGVYYSR